MKQSRWINRPEGSNWGDFGADDRLGRLNLITVEKVLQGISEVEEGRVFCLSLPLDFPGGNSLNPNRHPPVLRPTLRHGKVNFNCLFGEIEEGRSDVLSDDLAVLHLQYSTQWDGLAHVGAMFDANGDGVPEPVYYNGFAAGSDIIGPIDPADAGLNDTSAPVTTSSAGPLGIDHMAERAVQGRAVLIDLHAHYGNKRVLIGYDALAEVLKKDRVVVEPGDIVCLHTGFSEILLDMQRRPDVQTLHNTCAVLDGRDPRLLSWITESGVAAIAADNYAIEAYPAKQGPVCCAALPLHEHCLFKLGVHLGELWRLTPLANHLRLAGRSRFLLTAPPLRLPGAVASPVTPVATV